MDATIGRLEGENVKLLTQLAELKGESVSKNGAETNVVVRGLQSKLLALMEEKDALSSEIASLGEQNKGLQQVLSGEGDVKEVQKLCETFWSIYPRGRWTSYGQEQSAFMAFHPVPSVSFAASKQDRRDRPRPGASEERATGVAESH